MSEAEERFSRLAEDAGSKEKELYAVDQTLNIKSKRLSQINIDLLNYENKINELKEDVNNYEKLRSEYKEKLVSERATYDDLFHQNQKLQELVPLLEKRRKEIEQGNAELENRFTKMFQTFNRELNEINKKRSVLEQIVLKKENDIEEKDQLLFEKIAALEESDNVLNVRQVEIESFQSIIKAMTEQKEQIQDDLLKIDGEAVERKNYISDLRAETELLMQKKVQLEKGLHELLKLMSDNFYKTEERKLKLDSELRNYEDKLRSSRDKINDSMRDLTELQSTIKAAKMEHEEYKTNISKMAAMKKRLHEEILKQQAALQKYQKLREKLKIEQALVKDKQIGGPYKGGESELNTKGKNDDPQRNAQIYKL